MVSSTQEERHIRFGEFELHTRTRELQRNGERFAIQEQPFLVLMTLLERPGDLVTREELTKRLWPADTFVDFEHGLNKAVKRLREVLGDSADAPRFIETLPRQGYRFIGPIERDVDDPDVDRPVAVSTAVVFSKLSESLWGPDAWVACAVLLAAAATAYYLWVHPKYSTALTKTTRVSHWNKAINDATLSPDGHTVAFDSPVADVAQVFLMITSGSEPLQLTNDDGDKRVFNFSPDGKEIYYGTSLGHGEVWAVPTLGGSPRRVLSSATSLLPSSDGTSVYFTKVDNSGIFRARSSGLNEQLVYKPETTGQIFLPLLLFPGGDDLLAGEQIGYSPSIHILKVGLTSHLTVDLGEIPANSPFGDLLDTRPNLVWDIPGKSVLFSRTINGLTNIWKYGLQDRSLMQITFGTGPDYAPMLDPGGKGIYFVNGVSSGFLIAYHVPTRESVEILSEDATQPEISPDGKHLIYVTFPGPQKTELWVSNIDGSNKLAIASGEILGTGFWAPDNFHLSFVEASASAGPKSFIIGADGGGLQQLPPMGGIGNPLWSPDQKSVYVSVTEETEPLFEIWKTNADLSSAEKLVSGCASISDVAPDGRYLLGHVLFGEKTGIYEVSIPERKCILLLPGVVTFGATFAVDGKAFLYAVESPHGVTIFRQTWRSGKLIGPPKVALKVPFPFPIVHQSGNAYDFSRDLSTIVYVRRSGKADLYLLSQQ